MVVCICVCAGLMSCIQWHQHLFSAVKYIRSLCIHVAVLALAYGSSMEDLTFVGMVGLLDPPRDGIQDAVLTLLSTGAHLKMVTGDAEETALAIGKLSTMRETYHSFSYQSGLLMICRPSGCTVASGIVGVVIVVVVIVVCNCSQMRTSKFTCLIFGASIGLDPG